MDTTEHRGHESSDANVRGVVWAGVALAVTALVVQVGLYFQLRLLATRAETVYVVQPGKQRRTILLAGLDYPFGYVLVEPGGPERILTGVYPDDDLLDELRAYFDLSDDSVTTVPRATI